MLIIAAVRVHCAWCSISWLKGLRITGLFLHKLFFLFIISVLLLKRFTRNKQTNVTTHQRLSHCSFHFNYSCSGSILFTLGARDFSGAFSGFATCGFGLPSTPNIPAALEKKPLVPRVYFRRWKSQLDNTRPMLNALQPFWAWLRGPSPLGEAQITSVSGLPCEFIFFSVCIHQFFLDSLENRKTWRRLSVWEAMVTRDFMRSLSSRSLKVIWVQHRTGRTGETRPDPPCTDITCHANFVIEGGKRFSRPLRRTHLFFLVYTSS